MEKIPTSMVVPKQVGIARKSSTYNNRIFVKTFVKILMRQSIGFVIGFFCKPMVDTKEATIDRAINLMENNIRGKHSNCKDKMLHWSVLPKTERCRRSGSNRFQDSSY